MAFNVVDEYDLIAGHAINQYLFSSSSPRRQSEWFEYDYSNLWEDGVESGEEFVNICLFVISNLHVIGMLADFIRIQRIVYSFEMQIFLIEITNDHR